MKLRFIGMFLIFMLLFSSHAVFANEDNSVTDLWLVNEDTLRLRIRFDDNSDGLQNCNISISDALSQNGFTISFQKSLEELDEASKTGILTCTVNGSCRIGRETFATDGKYDFILLKYPYYTNCYELILDAVDFSAAEALAENGGEINKAYISSQNVKQSCSITRFGICDAIIYAKCGDVKSGYEYSLYSGGSGDDKRIISSSRALFNIRFDTDPYNPYSINKKRQYLITRDIDYTAAIDSSNPNEKLYKYDGMKETDTDGFIPIEELRGSIESSKGVMCIKNMCLMLPKCVDKYKEKEIIQGREYINVCDIGIFRKNYGTVKNINLYNITALFEQCDRVGTVCGTNAGILSGIEVTQSHVSGRFFTGGIAGKDGYYYTDINDEVSGKREYSRLKFGSKSESDTSCIHGQMYTGGIVGQINPYKITSEGGSVRAHERTVLSGCENYADIIPHGENPAYTGGICGEAVGAEIREASNTRPTLNGGRISNGNASGKISYTGGICGSMTVYRGSRIITSTIKNAHNSAEIHIDGICEYTGGICGMNEDGIISSKPNDITNSANIILSGNSSYTGGIAGFNSGIIGGKSAYARNIGFIHTDGDFTGGIAGFNTGSVLYCQSGQDFNLLSLFKDSSFDYDAFYKLLTGRYTGGIVGANSVDGCVMFCENTGGYVFGGEYTGGIIGIQLGGGGICGHKNSADIFSKSTAGGICAVNAMIDDVSVLLDTKDFDFNLSCRIGECKNYGAVFVLNENGGGICGTNAGIIENCVVDSADKDEDTVKLYTDGEIFKMLLNGKCTGGVTGSNSGIIRSVKLKSVFVTGGMYTGGIAGYNKPNGTVEKTNLNRGFIKGGDCVGGLIGLNRCEAVFNEPLSCRANVSGRNFTGGFIGVGCISSNSMVNITLNPKISAAESSVEGKHFVSGGIACLCSDECDIYTEYEQNGFDYIYNKYAKMGFENIKGYVNISGSTSSSIKAESIAGGVSCFFAGLRVYITKAVNYGDILVTDSIKTSVFNQYQNAPDVTNQSFSGGIISVASRNVYISNCQNKGSQTALKGYSGGIAAINCGNIRFCRVYPSIGKYQEYFGAVTGLNIGKTEECTLTSPVLSGNALGGIASVNEGRISQCQAESDVVSSGIIAGGIAGINAGEIENCTADMNVSSKEIAGGIAGINFGSIKKVSNSPDKSVYADDIAGGIMGICQNALIDTSNGVDYVINNSKVTAKSGSAGGICAVLENSSLYGLENFGDVSALNQSGGICAKNNGVTEKCKNHANIESSDLSGGIAAINEGRIFMSSSDNGLNKSTAVTANTAGGICAKNNGQITACEVISNDGTVSANASESGCAGGICGYNTGLLINSCIDKISVFGKNNTALGGVCGINTGTVKNTNGNILYAECKKQSDKDLVYCGGVCGINSGTIFGIYVSGTVYSPYPAAGGIAGINSFAAAKNYFPYITAHETSAQNSYNSDKAVIEDCFFISSYGSAIRCTKSGYSGGVAGINAEDGYIINSKPVYSKNIIEISSPDGFSGGIAGENEGYIDMCAEKIALLSPATKEQKPYFIKKGDKIRYKINIIMGNKNSGVKTNGAAGGIAGKNSGIIKNAVSGNTEYGFGTSVSVYSNGSRCYAGGICGYNTGSLDNVTNNASVICESGFAGGICGYNFNGEFSGKFINNGMVRAKSAGHIFGEANKSPSLPIDFKSNGNVYSHGVKTSSLRGGADAENPETEY